MYVKLNLFFMKRLTLILSCFLLSMSLAIGQNVSVSGTVVDESGEPIIGASIDVKGDARYGAISDVNGRFSFEAPSSAKTLEVSFIGKETQEVPVGSNVSVVLYTHSEVLDEVLVVAYGTAKKSSFTGSASVVKSDDIGKLQTTNATDALKGRVAGVQMATASGQPGASDNTIRVRGISSINAGQDPLVILDGSPFDGDMNALNNQDIESMTVLKDAASTALYGSRAANGVIIITTKKGKSKGGSASVTVDAKWGVNTRASQDYDYVTDPGQYYEMFYGASKNYWLGLGLTEEIAHKMIMGPKGMLSDGNFGLGYNVYDVKDGGDLIGLDGKLNPTATLGNVVNYNGQDYYLTPDNWLDEAYKNSFRQEYNISASGGNQFSSFYASVNYLDNEGITAKSDYERFSARLKADIQAKPWLKIGGNMSYSHFVANMLDNDGSSSSSGNVFAIATKIAPIYPLYIRDGEQKVMYDADGIKMYDYGDKGNANLTRPYLSNSNALSDLYLNTNNSEGNQFSGVGTAEITFLKDFIFTSTNSISLTDYRGTNVTNKYYGAYAPSKGIVYKSHRRYFSYNYIQQLNYLKSIDKHNIGAMFAHEYYRSYSYVLSGSGMNMFNPNNHELAGTAIDGSTANSYTTDYNVEGWLGRVQYDYDNKYYGMFSFRRDASSRFHPDHRWGNFWSTSAAWDMSNESFMEDYTWIDMLKLKASYGQMGNDNIGNYLYTKTYNIVNSNDNSAGILAVYGNNDITWETQGNFNVGIDFSIFKSRLSGSVEYFYRKTSDMLNWFTVAPSNGYTGYWDNIGDMRNQGVELDLTGTLFRNKHINWDLRFNLTHYSNKITKIDDKNKTFVTPEGVAGYQSGSYFYGEGESIYTFFMKKYAGVDEASGKPLYYIDVTDASGNVTRETTDVYNNATRYLCDTSLPDVTGGFGTTFSYRDFDLGVDFAYQLGGQVYDGDYAASMSSPTSSTRGSAFHKDLLKAWTPENKTSNIPRFHYGDTDISYLSDRFLTSASYLSLQNINLGYNVPRNICSKLGLNGVRVYAACDNVWLWSKRKGLDPRQSISGSSTASYYSPIRTISGGLTLTF